MPSSDSMTINIECVSAGNFIIDDEGIKSMHPVSLESSWNGNTLKLECGITDETLLKIHDNTRVFFHEKWSQTGRQNVIIQSITTTGQNYLEINIPLANDCFVDISDETVIEITSDNPQSHIYGTVSGSCVIRSENSVAKLSLKIIGNCGVYRFNVIKELRTHVSGNCSVSLRPGRDCVIYNKVTR